MLESGWEPLRLSAPLRSFPEARCHRSPAENGRNKCGPAGAGGGAGLRAGIFTGRLCASVRPCLQREEEGGRPLERQQPLLSLPPPKDLLCRVSSLCATSSDVVERSYRDSQLSGVFSKVAPLSSPPFPARNKHGRVLGWSPRGSGGYLESLAVYRPPHGQIATDVPRLDEWQGLWRIHTFYRPPFYGRRLQKS